MARTPNDPLREQLDALVGGGVPSDVREQHLSGIRAHASSLGPATVTAGRASGTRWEARRRVAALGAAGSLFVPGVAVASQGAVPGDALFGVKKATEVVVGVVDGRVAATNRLEELETLLDRGAELGVLVAALERADEAVGALDDAEDLEARLSLLEARVEALIEEAEEAAEREAREAEEREEAVAEATPDDEPSPVTTESEDDDETDEDTDADDDGRAESDDASDDDDDTDADESERPATDAAEDDETDDDQTESDDETDDDTDDDVEESTPKTASSAPDDVDPDEDADDETTSDDD